MFGRRIAQNSTNASNQQHNFTSLAARAFGGPALRTTPRTSWSSSKASILKPSSEPTHAQEIFGNAHFKRSKQIDNIWDIDNDEFDCSVSYF